MLLAVEQELNYGYVMGGKSHNIIKRIEGKEITLCKRCATCIGRMYNKEHSRLQFGIGNIFTNTVFVLNDINEFPIVSEVYKGIKGTNIEEECYCTTLYKCTVKKNDLNNNKIVLYNCIEYLYEELNRINPKRVVVFNTDISGLLEQKCYAPFYIISPKVMLYNNQKLKDRFEHEFYKSLL